VSINNLQINQSTESSQANTFKL